MSLHQHNDGSESLETHANTLRDHEASSSSSPEKHSDRKSRKDGQKRHVTFPEDSQLITGYLEPVNPWQSVGEISGGELIEEYVYSCRRHDTIPQQTVIDQLKEYVFVGASRSGNLSLSSKPLLPAQCEALEAIFRRARFNRIEVCNVALTDETAVALFDMLEYYESASELDISCNTEFGILGWQACSRMINKCQHLEQLEARGTSISESTAPVLGRGLRSPCALRVLHLQRAGLRGRPMLCLASALKQNKSVRELHIGDNNLLPEDANHLASLLRCNTFLQLLDISNNDIQDQGIESIADALSEQHTPSTSPSSSTSTSSSSTGDSTTCSPQSAVYQERGLAVLIVWNNNLTRNSGQHLSKALTRCKSLEVLNIGQNPLGGETINRVRVALQQNKSLVCLGVQGARLGAEAGVALAEVIEDNNCIQRIDLRDNKLQVAGLLALATALKKNYVLTRLDLDDAPHSVQSAIEQPLEEARLIDEIHALCKRNEAQEQSTPSTPTEENLHRRRVASFSTRKISLTCQTLQRCHEPPMEPALSPPKLSSGRLRSPLPSPVPSPASSPIPSPSHKSRFVVSRVSDSSSVTSESSSPSTPPSVRNFLSNSRFKVVTVQEPPKINVTMAPEEIKMNEKGDDKISVGNQTDDTLNKSLYDDSFKAIVGIASQEVEASGIIHDRRLNHSATKEDGTEDKTLLDTSLIQSTNAKVDQENTSSDGNLKQYVNCKASQIACGAIKKNKSESSLDSPDLEVSRLMLKKEVYDSSSSLDISGSSMESLNNVVIGPTLPCTNTNVTLTDGGSNSAKDCVVFSLPDETEDVFPPNDYKNPFIHCISSESNSVHVNRKKLSASSNESSLESSTFEAGVTFPCHAGQQSNLLNSSVSSNESVSPNIFGKHMKLHGSVTSLEASVSSLDSYKSKNDFVSPQYPATPESSQVVSLDSGISQSDIKIRTPSFNESFSSNEGTLTSSSNVKSSIFSMGGDSSLSIEEDNDKGNLGETIVDQQFFQELGPRRVTSLLDVPSMQKCRTRKISCVAPSNAHSAHQSQPPTKSEGSELQLGVSSAKTPSSLEKLLGLFQHPGSLFSRSDTVEKKSSDSSQCSSRRDSQTSVSSGSFWPWNLSTSATNPNKGDSKCTTLGALERLKKYGESFETALQFNSESERKSDMHSSKSDTYLESKDLNIMATNKLDSFASSSGSKSDTYLESNDLNTMATNKSDSFASSSGSKSDTYLESNDLNTMATNKSDSFASSSGSKSDTYLESNDLNTMATNKSDSFASSSGSKSDTYLESNDLNTMATNKSDSFASSSGSKSDTYLESNDLNTMATNKSDSFASSSGSKSDTYLESNDLNTMATNKSDSFASSSGSKSDTYLESNDLNTMATNKSDSFASSSGSKSDTYLESNDLNTMATNKSDSFASSSGSKSDTYLESNDLNTMATNKSDSFASSSGSKSDTYLESNDLNTMATNKSDSFASSSGPTRDFTCDVNTESQQSNSPPLYSVGSEYLKQTLACVVHAFQHPNVSIDFTLTIGAHVRPECTCRPDARVHIQNSDVALSFETNPIACESTLPCNDDHLTDTTCSFFNTARSDCCENSTISQSGNIVPGVDATLCEAYSIKIPECTTEDTSLQECNPPMQVVEKETGEIVLLPECIVCDKRNSIFNTEANECKQVIILSVDSNVEKMMPYEMGSVFKFHDVYEESEDARNACSKESVVVPKDSAETVKNRERTLSESEQQNIYDIIVRSVLEEGVKSGAAKCKMIEDSGKSLTGTNKIILEDNVQDTDHFSNIDESGAHQVQNIEKFDCDNSTVGNINKGCSKCDCSKCNCKYMHSSSDDDDDVVHNVTVDLKYPTLLDDKENSERTPSSLSKPNQSIQSDVNSSSTDLSEVTTSSVCLEANMKSIDSVQHLCDIPVQTETDPNADTEVCIHIDAGENQISKIRDIDKKSIVNQIAKSEKSSISLDKKNNMYLNSDISMEATRPTELALGHAYCKEIPIVLKQSIGLENKTSNSDRQPSPEAGPSVTNLPVKIVRGIKENVSPENTLTSSMSNTKALAQELLERKKVLGCNTALWEIGLKENIEKVLDVSNTHSNEENNSKFYDELLLEPFNKLEEIIKASPQKINNERKCIEPTEEYDYCVSTKYDESSLLHDVDEGSDALTVMELLLDDTSTVSDGDVRDNSTLKSALDDDESLTDASGIHDSVAAQQSEIRVPNAGDVMSDEQNCDMMLGEKDLIYEKLECIAIDVASEVIVSQANQPGDTITSEASDVFHDVSSHFKPVSILKKATSTISKTVSLPQNIPEATKPHPCYGFTLPTPKKSYEQHVSESPNLPIRYGSLPENSSTISMDTDTFGVSQVQSRLHTNSRSPVQSKLGKMARDSLYALNMSEDEIREHRTSTRLSSMDSVRSLGSLSEDMEGLSCSSYIFQHSSDGDSILEQGASQDSLVSLDSISENVSEADHVEGGSKTHESL